MGGNNEFFENFERNKYLKKLPSMQRVKVTNMVYCIWSGRKPRLCTYSVWINQHVDGVEVEGERYLSRLQLLEPVLEEQAAEVLVEGAAIRQESRAHQHITHQPENITHLQ